MFPISLSLLLTGESPKNVHIGFCINEKETFVVLRHRESGAIKAVVYSD